MYKQRDIFKIEIYIIPNFTLKLPPPTYIKIYLLLFLYPREYLKHVPSAGVFIKIGQLLQDTFYVICLSFHDFWSLTIFYDMCIFNEKSPSLEPDLLKKFHFT